MPNIEWSVPQMIVSPYMPDGLGLNTPLELLDSGVAPFFLVKADGYQIVPGKFRSVIDSISQADGVSLQPPFIDGLVATLTVEYWVAQNGEISQLTLACGSDARQMDEMLMGVLNSLRTWTTDPNNMQRYTWLPTGTTQRGLTNVLLAAWPTIAFFDADGGAGLRRVIALGTPYPYGIDLSEIDTIIDDGDSAAIANDGNASQSPVMRVAGPFTVFTITDTETGEEISYDSSRPGAVAVGPDDFAEIDFFQGSIFLNGDSTDLVAGLDPEITDLFTLDPGSQTIAVTGANVTVLSNPAYV